MQEEIILSTKDDITKEENFKVKIDDFIDWEVAFLEL